MSFALNLAQIQSAANGNSADMRQMLTAVYLSLQTLHAATGTLPLAKVDSAAPSALPPPPQTSFSVTGSNGAFTYTIAAPQNASKATKPVNILQATIYYQLASAPVSNFASGVTAYPITTNTTGTFQNPGATLYWRVRSSYDHVTWNQWRVLANAVSAGLLTSGASNPNLSLNQTNFATVDSIPNGASATIRVYGVGGVGTHWPRIVGTQSPVIAGASIGNVPYGYNGFVAWDGESYQVSSQLAKTFPDNWTPVGAVSVVANAGGFSLPAVTPIVVSGSIIAYQITNPGNDIGSLTLTVVGTGSGATPVATIKNGQLVDVRGSAGSGYGTSGTTVTVTGSASPGTPGGGGNSGGNGGRLYTVGS